MESPVETRSCVDIAPDTAKSRLKGWGEPLFIADWAEPVFLHFSCEPDILQPHVPFPLDTFDGKAYISLVAFTMRNMRFRVGGKFTRWMTGPIATHSFLNLRTYVKCGREPGIHFLCEWLNSRIATQLGPCTFGLPYRFAELDYRHNYTENRFSGTIQHADKEIAYDAVADPGEPWRPSRGDTLDEFLLERYTAFTARGPFRGLFRVWHEPWPHKRLVDVKLKDLSLLKTAPGGDTWADQLRFAGGNVSTGAFDVWMGRPHLL